MDHKLPKLPYSYNSLEPYIDDKTMQIHHTKHHQAYIDNLNSVLGGEADLSVMEVSELLKNIDSVPEKIRSAVVNNGGGHANHTLFWEIMSPDQTEPEGNVGEAIGSTFGSLDNFKVKFAEQALKRFGSGWVWLVVKDNKLDIYSTPNQDSPLMNGDTPILGLDVWEHAYYLNYQNRRADYVKAWWNIVNWKKVNENLNSSTS